MSATRLGAVLFLLASMLACQGALHSAWGEPAGSRVKRPAKATCDRAAFVVVLDVGHTAESPGARSARGLREYEFNLRLGSLIEKQLVDGGFGKTVLLITDGPARKGLVERVVRANRAGAHLFVSIHHDSVPNMFLEKWEFDGQKHSFSDRFKGHSIFISSENGDSNGSLLFGRLLGRELKTRGLQYTPHYSEKVMANRRRQLVDAEAGVYRYDQLIVLKTTQMPAVLLEAGSIINRDEELLMGSPEHQALIGSAVVDAVEAFCASRGSRTPDLARRAGASALRSNP